jgi:hypothetical protein
MTVAAMVARLDISSLPVIYRIGRPISVARPTASSTASRPGMRRRKMLGLIRARRIDSRTVALKASMISRLLSFAQLKRFARGTAETGGLSALVCPSVSPTLKKYGLPSVSRTAELDLT